MIGRLMPGLFFLMIALVGGSSPAPGQTAEVGLVDQILERRGRPVDATPHGSILRAGESRARIQAKESLFYRDVLRLNRPGILLDLTFVQDDMATRAIVGTRRLDRAGIYEIRETTVAGISRMQLVIRQGVMVIQHAAGELEAIAAGVRCRIFGTTVLFVVDESESEGIVFLKEGTMYYPDYDLELTGPSRAWTLREGERPARVTLDPEELRRLEQEIVLNTDLAWRPPFWQKPAFFIPAAAILLGATVYVVTQVY